MEERRRKYPIITLCGSTKFKEEFFKVQRMLALEDKCIVLNLDSFEQSDGETFDKETINMIVDKHLEKIAMSDGIFVVNPNGYIGSSTSYEIDSAIFQHKWVRFLEIPKQYVSLKENTQYYDELGDAMFGEYIFRKGNWFRFNKYPFPRFQIENLIGKDGII